MKQAILFLFTVILFQQTIAFEDTNAALVDVAASMKAYGFSSGQFVKNAKLVTKLDESIVSDIAAFEKTDALDSSEEFLTAAFYSQLKPESAEGKAVILQQLASGRNGGIKLAAMWLRKGADHTYVYEKALSYIESKHSLSHDQVQNFYQAAIVAEIDVQVARILKGIPLAYYTVSSDAATTDKKAKASAIDILKEYYKKPSENNYTQLADAVFYFGKKGTTSAADNRKFKALVRLIEVLSPALKMKIAEDMLK